MKGGGPIASLDHLNVLNAKQKGMQRTQLLKNPTAQKIKMPKTARAVEFTNDHVHVPQNDTTYWCHVMKLPDYLTDIHHIIQVIQIFNNLT